MAKNLKEIEAQTQCVYQDKAKAYDESRNRDLFEKGYLEKFLALQKGSPSILDLGCGSGEPIARFFIESGLKVRGIDYSEPMLEIARKRFPHQEWTFGDMRNFNPSDFGGEGSYSGIVSWGSFFHLNQQEQREALPKICSLLRKDGILLMTVGHEEGEVTGIVEGRDVYHSSLSQQEYQRILEESFCEVLEFNLRDANCNFFSVFLARKS